MKGKDLKYWSEKEENSGSVFTSPAMGLNDNLEFMGKLLHVQTENTTFPVAHIVTQVFSNGHVILSIKSEFPSGFHESLDFGKVQQLMRKQHIQVIQEIRSKQSRILGSR